MLFKKNKINLEEMQTSDPEGYTALMEAAKGAVEVEQSEELTQAKARIKELEDKDARAQVDAQITEYGNALKVPDAAKKAIEDGVDFNTALKAMVDDHIKNVKDIEESFEETTPDIAGESLEEGNDDDPKTFGEAINMIAERDKCSKADASQKAKKEFPKLLEKRWSQSEYRPKEGDDEDEE